MRQRSVPVSQQLVLSWNVLGVAAAAGLLVIALAWFLGPGLFGITTDAAGSTAQAEVVTPAACTGTGAGEKVKFSLNGQNRDGVLNACGHGKGERVDVQVPESPPAGVIQLTAAETATGAQDARRPVGLVLLVFSCFCGGMYTFLVLRGPRRVVAA